MPIPHVILHLWRSGSPFLNCKMMFLSMLLSMMGIFGVLDSGKADGTDSKQLSLEDACRMALLQQPSLEFAKSQQMIAHSRVLQAKSGLLPSVNIQGVATAGLSAGTSAGSFGNSAFYGTPTVGLQGITADPLKSQYASSLNIVQPVFDFGRTSHLIAARHELENSSGLSDLALQSQVILDVEKSYLNVLRATQLVDVQQQNLHQREDIVQQADLFAKAELKSGVDLQLAEANSAQANVLVLQAQNAVKLSYTALNYTMGHTTEEEYVLNGSSPLLDASLDNTPEDTLIKLAEMQRPEIAVYKDLVTSEDQTIRGIQSDQKPRMDAVVSLGVARLSSLIKKNNNYSVGLAVTIPLYSGGFVEGRIEEEKEKRLAYLAQEKQVDEIIHLQVSDAWLNVQTQLAQVEAAKSQTEFAEKSAQLATDRYKLKLSSIVELDQAEGIATAARAQLVNAQYDLAIDREILNWAVGNTNVKKLRLLQHLEERAP